MPPIVNIFPLKTGIKLLTIPLAELEDKMDFVFDIAFAQPKAIEGHSVLVKLHQMAHLIYQTVATFERNELLR